MQVAATRGVGYLSHDGSDAREPDLCFSALFVVAGSKAVEAGTVRNRLRLSEGDFRGLLDQLQRRYLVDVVSQLQDGSVVEHLRLTEEGASALQLMLERMCELPELE